MEFAGGGVWTLALATFFAMLIARAVDDQPIVVAQAAVSAVLITTFGSQGQGWERLVDALIGVGVALVFSQLLFVPEPLRLLRRAESAVLCKSGRRPMAHLPTRPVGPRVGWSLLRSCGSVAPAHRSAATGRILLQGNGIGAPGAKHRLDDSPRLDGLVATH